VHTAVYLPVFSESSAAAGSPTKSNEHAASGQ
jgi:hypothetical protein